MKELIEKLKDPKQAQAYWMRTIEEQSILFKAGPERTLIVDCGNKHGRKHYVELSEWREQMIILKPDYEPEPEYEDIDIVVKGHWLILQHSPQLGMSCCVNTAVTNRNFIGFFATFSNYENRMALPDIATRIREGHKVCARFVKGTP